MHVSHRRKLEFAEICVLDSILVAHDSGIWFRIQPRLSSFQNGAYKVRCLKYGALMFHLPGGSVKSKAFDLFRFPD